LRYVVVSTFECCVHVQRHNRAGHILNGMVERSSSSSAARRCGFDATRVAPTLTMQELVAAKAGRLTGV
jgi:hypothetical protein